jgi:hypothetical protein
MAIESPVLVAIVGALGALGGAVIGRRTSKESNHMAGFEKLSAAEARFRDTITQRLDDCEERHKECEAAAHELRVRVAALEEKIP